jgi:hypothetical protein
MIKKNLYFNSLSFSFISILVCQTSVVIYYYFFLLYDSYLYLYDIFDSNLASVFS